MYLDFMQEYEVFQMVLVVKNLLPNARYIRDVQFDPWVGKTQSTATHSSILTSRILRTEEPGGLWSKGSHRVKHN